MARFTIGDLFWKRPGASKARRAALFFWLASSATHVALAASHYSFKTWDNEDGLPQKTVIAMTQTRDGYLWLGTFNGGLARFDGTRFTTFNEGNTPELTSGEIVKLFEDSRGNLWIGTRSAGIFVAMGGKVKAVDSGAKTPLSRLMSICEDDSGAVWLYTAAGELCRYHNGKGELVMIGAGNASYYRTVMPDKDLLWVGWDTNLVALGPVPSETLLGIPVAHEEHMGRLDYLLRSRSGGYWRLSDGQIQKWSGEKLQRDLCKYPWNTNVLVTSACEDGQGNLIVGTYGAGVFWFDESGHFNRLTADLPSTYVLSLLMDHEGSLWVGTDGRGVVRARPQVFEVFEDSLGRVVNSVCEDSEKGVWVGYQEPRVDHWNGVKLQRLSDFEPLPFVPTPQSVYVRSVLQGRDGKVWVGMDGGGLLQLYNGKFLPAPGSERLPSTITTLYEDKAGRLWVAAPTTGLACFDGRSWKAYNVRGSLQGGAIRAITEDRQGNLWVGTQGGGLNCLRNGQWTSLGKTNGLPSNSVFSLYADADDVLWIGTGSGLARLQAGKTFAYAARQESLGVNAGYIVEDGFGYLWMGSTAGLVRARKQDLNELAGGKNEQVAVRVFGKPDGLPDRECSQGSQPVACRARDGTLWFPTIGGLVSVNPSLLKKNTNAPPVVIESVKIDGQPQTTNSLRAPMPVKVTVPPRREILEIDYTSLNLSAPDKGLFRYRLAPHESGWTEVDAKTRSVRYSKLPPADYKFQVTACNEDGEWNPTGATLAVTVLPAFWQTKSFKAAVVVSLILLLAGSVYYVSTQRLQQQVAVLRQHEALEKERGRIARDLHDQLGANLTQVALLGEMAETDKDLPEEVESHARQISQTARDTTRSLDEIVWTVNPSNDTLDELINYLCKYAQEYFALAGLRYRIDVPPKLPHASISPEVRHNVFLAAKEAVNNIVKHSKAASAWLRLNLEPDKFVIEIEDNGRGLAAGDENKGRNGLRNMRKRMEDIGGKFEAGAGTEGGTKICLTAPLRHAEV